MRLWTDDASALAWMAPRGAPGVQVLPWPDQAPTDGPGDVVIEAFGCEIAPQFIAAIACQSSAGGQKPLWINLEYLSAESYVERCHRLPSPLMSGPGAGLTRLSEEAVKDYALDGYKLQISSEAGMLTTVDRAMRKEEWLVATSWSPHWMFGKYELRYIDDPKGALGNAEHVDILARKDFEKDNPEVAGFLSRMKLPIGDLEAAMFTAQETSYEEAVDKYIADHPEQIKAWLAKQDG